MQNGTVNGVSHQDEPVTPKPDASSNGQSVPEHPPDPATLDSIPSEPKNDEVATIHPEGPPSKKRKLAGAATPRRSLSRAPSPPWKKAGVDGPTTFIQDGRRKSSRVNTATEMQPPSEKRSTREVQKQFTSKNGTGGGRTATSSPSLSERSGKGRGGKASANGSPVTLGTTRGTGGRKKRVSESPVPKQSHSRTRSRSSGFHHPLSESVNGSSPNAGRSYQSPSITNVAAVGGIDDFETGLGDGEHAQGDETGQRVPRLRIKVKKPFLGVQHPSHVLPPRKYGSFRDWMNSEDGKIKDDGILTPAGAVEEAERRRQVQEAAEPGGLLSAEVCSAYIPEHQEEPPQQYSHQDHLVSHALYFKKLLDQEHRRHRHTAKLFAQWCADAWRKRNKDPEDVLREQQEEMRGKRKQLAKDLQKMFDLARAEVDRVRLARWEEERKVEDQQALDRAIKQSTMLFEKRRQEILGETGSDMPESSEGEEGETDDSEDGEDNMSSDSDSEDGANGVDDDEGLTAEELRLKYSNLPQARASVESESAETASSDQIAGDPGLPPEQLEVEDVNPMLMDDSEASTDMDDDMGDSDGNQESEDGSEEEEEEDGPGLLGFFAPKDVGLDGHDDDGNVDDDDHALAHDLEEEDDEEDEEEPEDTDEVFLVPNNAPAEPEAIFQDVIPHDDEHPSPEPTKESESIPNPESVSESKPDASPAPEQEQEPPQIEMGDAAPTDNETPLVKPEQTDSNFPTEMEMDRDDHQHLEARRPSREVSSQASPGTLATKPSEPESVSSYDAPPATAENEEEKALQVTGSDGSPAPGVMKTPLPHLIRGDLREYQHFGLDWLAGLYSNHINGILADEMGLGKTIQTIALLAHLALENEVWGPHLVVVPTSVILNWEMEFKKWCPGFKIMTYYGNQEERRQKRKGWMDDTSWNVLITSYQLVLQDQQVLKRRAWHYMILDEAHNIKNFRSQRWQALLTFRTRARLLLTGTPLQNNLTELWSLLFFLMPSDGGDESGIEGFADLRNFSEWFRRPVEQILEHGRETMDDEAKQVVTKLHTVLRPYILRRLKADVEKQMPGKYEHVVYCRLSKRQRFLYDGFMSRAQTKETLETGNYLSIINCLMQLRKVCNHPDLFETRQISTSFAMHKSVATEFEIKDFLVRRRLLFEHPLDKLDLDFLNLVPISRENISRRLADDSTRLMAYGPFNALRERQYNRTNWQMGFDGSTMQSTLDSLENNCRKSRMAELERCLYFESKRHGRRPVYGSSLIEFLTADSKDRPTSNGPLRKQSLADWLSNRSSVLASMILSVEERSQAMEGYVQRFACVTPAAVAAGITAAALTPIESRSLTKKERLPPFDPFHEAQMRLSIAFPDKRLLQYDCGKLQRLDKLLRDLKAGGHRALIFTQMTKMLDILEQFLNIHGHRYLRLDGTTKVEQRQILTDRFNNDDRILAFILSSRSGGLGINLTGADAVIFYDLDWNPAMDKQCQDRCHRIGQTRDVHIYRFVSEYTIESNILRKANQKRMLDDVVIQEGEFNTDYMTKLDPREMFGQDDALDGHQDAATAAMDRVLETRVGGGGGGSAGAGGGPSRVFEQAEDKEDIDAAKNAQKELEHADQDDFEDRSIPGRPTAQATTGPEDGGTTPGAQLVTTPQVHGTEDEVEVENQPGDIDEYLLRFMEWNMKDEPLVLPADKSKKKSKKGKEHRLKRRR